MKNEANDVAQLPDDLQAWLNSALDSNTIACKPLQAEASFRQFYRLQPQVVSRVPPNNSGTCVLMVSPPDKERNDQFVLLAAVFANAGLPVPALLAADETRGWFLLTDLGPRDLKAAYGTSDEVPAVTAAIDALISLQQISDPRIPPYTAERLHDELGIFTDWFLGALLDCVAPDWISTPFDALVTRLDEQPQCCVHRDYHCKNLMFNNGQLGIVDFQDALVGPASYDLASLLHDCYHRFSAAAVDHWRHYYLAQSSQRSGLALNPAAFSVDLEYAAIQRQLKAIGIFARLHYRDGKSSHLPYIEPVLDSCARLAANHPALAELGAWLARLAPGPRLKNLV